MAANGHKPDDQSVRRVPPHNLQAEESILGAALLSADALEVLATRLTPEDFYRPINGHIAAVLTDAYQQGWKADPVTVSDELGRLGLLEAVGGLSHLLSLQVNTPATSNASRYADIISTKARSRQLIAVAGELAEAGYTSGDPSAILDRLGQLATSTVDPARFLDGHTWIYDRPAGTPAVWGEDDQVLWAQGEPLLIVGPTGVGKTTVTQQIVFARLGANNSDVLGYPVEPSPKPVLYLACDRPSQIARSFKRAHVDNPEAMHRLIVWPGPPPKDFAKHPTILLEMAKAVGAGTVIVDSLKDVALKISDDETGAGVNRAMQHAVAEGIEVCALHHQRKGQGGAKPRTLEDVYGSTWITAGAGSVIILWGTAGSPIVELTHLKQPAAPVGPLEIVHDHNTGTSSVSRGPVDALIVLRNSPHGVTSTELAQRACSGGTPGANDVRKAKRALDRLVARGLAHMVEEIAKGGSAGTTPARYHAVVVRDEADIPDPEEDF